MAKKSFKKYEYEGIRTEYYALTTAAAADIEARNVVKVASGAVSADSAGTVNNSTVFLLAEDVKKGDLGFVYYIIEDVSNLI
jgi:hypothetical protein